MEKNQGLTKDEKLSVAYDYSLVKEEYQKHKKGKRVAKVFSFVGALSSLLVGLLFGLPFGLYSCLASCMTTFPFIYVHNYWMREIAENLSLGIVDYKTFQKMEKSGELENLIKEINENVAVSPDKDIETIQKEVAEILKKDIVGKEIEKVELKKYSKKKHLVNKVVEKTNDLESKKDKSDDKTI